MKSLRQKLKEDLNYYELKSKSLEKKHIIEIPGFDFDLNWLAIKRERLEKHRFLLSRKEQLTLEEADLRIINLWNQVKDVEPQTPYNRIAKAFLEDIVKLAQKQPTKTTA